MSTTILKARELLLGLAEELRLSEYKVRSEETGKTQRVFARSEAMAVRLARKYLGMERNTLAVYDYNAWESRLIPGEYGGEPHIYECEDSFCTIREALDE